MLNFFLTTATAEANVVAEKSDGFVTDGFRSFLKYILDPKFIMSIVTAILVFIIGKIIVKFLANMISKAVTKTNKDKTFSIFVKNTINFIGMIFVIIIALDKLGLPMATGVAAVGAAGLAIGLAFQGSLSNFAAGLMIVAFRPFQIDDIIDAGGVIGKVKEISPFTTTLITADNRTIIMPNSALTSSKIENYTVSQERRIDMVFSTSYADDSEKVKKVIRAVLENEPLILKTIDPIIAMLKQNESSIDYAVRPWAKTDDYWTVLFNITENMKIAFDREKISIPFPQRDIHIVSDYRNK